MVEPPVSYLGSTVSIAACEIGMRLTCDSMAKRMRNDDYSPTTYRDEQR
jgi:hypothetical protein